MQQTHKNYGLITGLVTVIVNLIIYLAGLSNEKWAQYLGFAPFIVGVVLNAFAFSKANDGYVTFGKVFSSNFKTCAIITLIGIAWSVASIYIFPELKDDAVEMARIQMEKSGNVSEEQIQQGLEMTRKFFVPFMLGGVIFSYMLFGAIFSLVGAAVVKKKGLAPQQNF